ncbi:MAG: 2-phosphotransferase [Sphingomonas bacterium]|uniref:RNA 2'-phosphotransferase n=1 Tax=Sphingomonas bacterium TaxID=1895847 RepID=UPI002607FD0A|nr:RNA 2'-phosphotransferase [Sphingomonas bacterium]MDB5705136.1 2-phosphotransferase [Sphingomonas bacterium]
MADDKIISKTMSLWLRHRPEAAGLTLDEAGWTDVDGLLAAFVGKRIACDWERLLAIVETSDKQRFELSADGARIRARQGHSVAVTLDWPQVAPPELLFHGTVARFLPAIRAEGLRPMRRHHVHLSPDEATATIVGNRRGEAVVLTVRAGAMAAAGRAFFLTGNGVWLTDGVPAEFLVGI